MFNYSNSRYFLVIAECGSVTKAAEILHVSQPSLSKYLRNIEAELGANVVDHSRKPLVLTEAGEAYRAHLLKVSEMERELTERFGSIRVDVERRITVAVGNLNASVVMPHVISRFARVRPDVQIAVKIADNSSCVRAIEAGEVDIALVFFPKKFSGLSFEMLRNESILLVFSTNHPRAAELCADGGKPVDISRVADEVFFIPPENLLLHRMTKKILRKAAAARGIDMPRLVPVPNPQSAVNIASMGEGFCFVIDAYAGASFFPRDVVMLPIERPSISMPFAAAWRKSRGLSDAECEFVEFLKDFYGKWRSQKSN